MYLVLWWNKHSFWKIRNPWLVFLPPWTCDWLDAMVRLHGWNLGLKVRLLNLFFCLLIFLLFSFLFFLLFPSVFCFQQLKNPEAHQETFSLCVSCNVKACFTFQKTFPCCFPLSDPKSLSPQPVADPSIPLTGFLSKNPNPEYYHPAASSLHQNLVVLWFQKPEIQSDYPCSTVILNIPCCFGSEHQNPW